MPKKTIEKKDEMLEKLEYIGLDLNNIPETIKAYEPLEFRPLKAYEENRHKQYRYINIKDIELLLSPTNRLDKLEEKYSKARPVYMYLDSESEENILRYTTFLSMLKKVKIEEIEEVEEEQKKLNKKIPFKVKFHGNYLWQIYYSENTDKYFMLVPTEDSDYSTFFYILKKQLDKKKSSKIFVPISHTDYSEKILKKSEIEDLENYLWLFTKDWPMIYEVYDKKDNVSIYIVGETEVYENIKTSYKIQLSDITEANKFYKLVKALFILQTEVPHYYKFQTNVDKLGSLEFYYENKKIDYENLTYFLKEEFLEIENLHDKADIDTKILKEKLENFQNLATELETEYVLKEKQISTFLECKKTFFGKVKYYFKYSKKSKGKDIREKIKEIKADIEKVEEQIKTPENVETEKRPKTPKEHYTIEELIENANSYYLKETEMKNLLMDINALKLKNKNMIKKIENATSYIEEIDSHKKSIFEFWKYTNKDEVSALAEGEAEEINVRKKMSKTFDYKEDIEELGKALDKQQRKVLSKEEIDSLFITTTNVLDILNKVKTNEVLPKDMETALKNIKKEIKEEKILLEKEEFDIFGGRAEDSTKVKLLANKKHREVKKDKFKILDITKNTKQLGYKLALEKILEHIKTAMEKVKITEDFPIYMATNDEKLNENKLNIFNLNPEQEVKNAIKQEGTKINLYKIKLTRNTNAIAYTNIIFYDNQNKTLPIGMDLSTKILFDVSKVQLKSEDKKTFKVVTNIEEDEFATPIVKTINVHEYIIQEENN